MFQAATDIPKKWIYGLLFILSLVLYGNSIPNNYGLDDEIVVTGNAAVQKGVSGIKEILNQPYYKKGGLSFDYRPVVMISFAIEYQLFGANPHVSHFINILLYALCLVLLYNLLTYVFEADRIHKLLPIGMIIIYAVHPIHTEVVDSLKNRDEILSMIFGLLFLIFGKKFNEDDSYLKWRYLILSLICLTLSLLSKFIGVVFIAYFILMAVFYGYFKRNKLNYLFLFTCFIITIMVITKIFSGFKRATNILENPLVDVKSFWVILGTSFKVLMYHFKMLVFPSIFRFYYGYNTFPLTGIADIYVVFSIVLHLSLLVYGVILFFKKDILGLFILSYFAAIFLYSNLFIPYTGIFSERALFVSSFWFITMVLIVFFRKVLSSTAFSGRPGFKQLISILFFMLCTAYSFKTIGRNFYWKDTLTLLGHDIKYLDQSVLANYIYANNLKEADSLNVQDANHNLAELATVYYKNTIELMPSYPEFYLKLASTYRYNLGKSDSAALYYKKAIEADSLYAIAYLELGKLYLEKNDFRNSTLYLSNAYLINPTDSVTMYYYAQSAASYGDLQTSYIVNKRFVERYPDLPVAYVNLGVCYSKMLKDDSAVINFEKAIQLGYREPQLLQQLDIYFNKKGLEQKSSYYRTLYKR